ncbi:MAG: A24 family peptidase [Micavibrio sp.]
MIHKKPYKTLKIMPEILALLCLPVAAGLLIALSVIDLREMILPDELNLALAVTGIAFHILTGLALIDAGSMLAGALAGGGLLYGIRFIANRYYGQDALGLGDVKLLAAAGLWLGPEGVLQAITLGALAGLLHGFAYAGWLKYKTGAAPSIHRLSIPAGPGFAVGIFGAGTFMLASWLRATLPGLLS